MLNILTGPLNSGRTAVAVWLARAAQADGVTPLVVANEHSPWERRMPGVAPIYFNDFVSHPEKYGPKDCPHKLIILDVVLITEAAAAFLESFACTDISVWLIVQSARAPANTLLLPSFHMEGREGAQLVRSATCAGHLERAGNILRVLWTKVRIGHPAPTPTLFTILEGGGLLPHLCDEPFKGYHIPVGGSRGIAGTITDFKFYPENLKAEPESKE